MHNFQVTINEQTSTIVTVTGVDSADAAITAARTPNAENVAQVSSTVLSVQYVPVEVA